VLIIIVAIKDKTVSTVASAGESAYRSLDMPDHGHPALSGSQICETITG